MTSFVTKLAEAAEEAVAHAHVPPAKVAPEPPHHSGDVFPSGGAARRLPVSVRTMVDHPALQRALERIGAGIPREGSARLVMIAETKLAGRAVSELGAGERELLVQALRAELVKLAPATANRQRQLIAEVNRMFSVKMSSDVLVSTTKAGDGVWVFFHSGPPTSPVIWGESFLAPAGTPAPATRPQLRHAGLRGTPTWRTASGTFVKNAPPLPTRPVVTPSGLPAKALEQGPEILLEEVTRARSAALDAARRQAAPLKLAAAPGTRRAGGQITSIQKRFPKKPGGAWDECVVVNGVTGPEVPRMSDSEMDKVLPRIGALTNDPELAGMARMHAFGPILGDETLAGLAYGPHEAANLLAKDTAEAFGRFDAKRLGRLNVKAGTPVRISQYIRYRPIKGAGRYPFVVTVKYEYALESGSRVVAVIDISPQGAVSFHVE